MSNFIVHCIGRSTQRASQELRLHNVQTFHFAEFSDFLAVFSKSRPDGIIMDLNIPGDSRKQKINRIRFDFTGPLILLGNNPSYTVQGEILEAGADDCMNMNDESLLILARIQAIKNGNIPDQGSKKVYVIENRSLLINNAFNQAWINDQAINLTLREWKVLSYLLENSGKTVTRRELLESCLEYQFDGYNRLLDTYIRNIRKKLKISNCLKTIHGIGYRMETEREASMVV